MSIDASSPARALLGVSALQLAALTHFQLRGLGNRPDLLEFGDENAVALFLAVPLAALLCCREQRPQ